MIWNIFTETAVRAAGIAAIVIPLLLLVEWANHRYGDELISFFEKRKKFMPFWAGVLAILPGCNVAAAIALLYAKRLVSMGALVAAMIATSDEAIYVFIPQKFNFLPLFGVKLVLAITAGFLVDLFARKIREAKEGKQYKVDYCCSIHEHVHDFKDMIIHVLKHGIKIVFFIFVVLFAFNLFKDTFGFNAIAKSALLGNNFQPIVASLVGLIPGCGTSVVLATLFTQGILSFGGALSGLAVASGDTILVLLANKMGKKEVAYIVGTVFLISVAAGYAANWLQALFGV